MKNKIKLIQISLYEQLNEAHKTCGETLNSRQILNDFILKMNMEFDELMAELEADKPII